MPRLADLLRETGAAHHKTFAATNGDDPEWPAWYARYLAPRLEQLLRQEVRIDRLAGDLDAMAQEHRGDKTKREWPEFYAQSLLARYSIRR
jgi:hypothetical protein